MSWTWQVTGGRLIDPTGTLQAKGYSGQPPHTNVAADEGLEGLGPIPRGNWFATGVEEETVKHGPFVIVLAPDANTRSFVVSLGRDPDSFRIHGERVAPPLGLASDGCIIISRDIRELFWASLDHDLLVTT